MEKERGSKKRRRQEEGGSGGGVSTKFQMVEGKALLSKHTLLDPESEIVLIQMPASMELKELAGADFAGALLDLPSSTSSSSSSSSVRLASAGAASSRGTFSALGGLSVMVLVAGEDEEDDDDEGARGADDDKGNALPVLRGPTRLLRAEPRLPVAAAAAAVAAAPARTPPFLGGAPRGLGVALAARAEVGQLASTDMKYRYRPIGSTAGTAAVEKGGRGKSKASSSSSSSSSKRA